jgi:integrase/recombinase XerD
VSGFRPSVAAPPPATTRLSALRVVLPGGLAYWTVVDEKYELVGAADEFLRDLRFGADRTESTTRLYASELALFLDWSTGSGRDLGRAGRVSASVIAALYEVGDDRFLPAELRAEDGALRYRVKPRHQLRVGRSGQVRACELSEWEALLRAADCWRDRFLLVLLWFSGLRIGEALGLRRSDMHLMASASELGCRVAGAHLHVVPRENVNGARAKGRRERAVPLAHYAVSYYDLYLDERERCRPAQECDFAFVNLSAEPLGAPMRYGRVAQLFRSLSRRAGLGRAITPHMLRHAAGSALTAAGGLDVAQAILGHASITSTQIYVHASAVRQRDAVERLSLARSRQAGAPR